MTTLNTIPAEESTLLQKKPQASLKFQAHMGAANASTKAKKIVGAVAAAALVLGVLAATVVASDVCMMPYVNTMGKKLEENDLDGAIMMGLPCIESDDDNYGNFNLQLWLVDSPTVQ